TADGLRYHNRVAVFDLETFTDQHVITTRAYTAGHLGYGPPHESDNTTAATLRRPAPTADYHTTLTDFADDLTSIHVCSDEPAFWVCFRDGILRRIALDGSHRSALVAFDRLPGRPSEDPFSRKYLHASICSDCSTDDRIVVESTCDELLGFDPTGLDLSDEAALVLVTPEPVDRQTVTRSEEQRQETEDLDRNVVPVADVDDPAALSAALDDLVRRFDDIDALRRGHTLLFVFRDPAGAEIDEADFFARAVTLDGGPERIAIILRRFIAFPGHEDLYRDEETVALAHALHALVLHDAAYLGLYADYYRELDVEHDVYNRETLLPAIFAQYDWSPALLQLLGVLEVVDPDAAELHGDDPALLALLAQDEHLRTLVDAIRTADTHDSYDPADGAGSRAGYRRLLAERFGAVAEQADAARGGAAQLIAQATGMGTAGDWAGALPLLVEAVRIDPTGLDARNLHAYALVALDDAAAPAALQAVLALDPHNAAALSNLALWHFRHGDREQGADAYRRMFATQPPAETLYHCFLCDVHGADHPLAEEAAEVFLALARSRDPEFESHAMTFAQLANDRARIQSAIQSGCCADAIDLARHHCEQAKAFYADEPARISEALHALGSVLEGAGAYEEAIAAYSEGAAIDQDGNSLESIDWAGAALKHNAIAECYRKSGDFSTCRQYYRFALDQGQTAWGDQHPHLAVFHANQAVCDMQLGFLEQAQEGFTTALAMAEAGLGPDHPDLATMLNNYAQLRLRQGRASEAVALAERAVANESAAYGSDHPATAMSMVVLANALLGDDRSDDARQVAQQAFAILSATWGADHPSVAGAHGLLGRLALADGDADTAVEHLHQATTIIAAPTGDTSPDTA
ncbi:MAG: tetratricopeptide repeat protein, partial [Planctomycetota bacterium]